MLTDCKCKPDDVIKGGQARKSVPRFRLEDPWCKGFRLQRSNGREDPNALKIRGRVEIGHPEIVRHLTYRSLNNNVF